MRTFFILSSLMISLSAFSKAYETQVQVFRNNVLVTNGKIISNNGSKASISTQDKSGVLEIELVAAEAIDKLSLKGNAFFTPKNGTKSTTPFDLLVDENKEAILSISQNGVEEKFVFRSTEFKKK